MYWTSQGLIKVGNVIVIVDTTMWLLWGLYGHWIFKYNDLHTRDVVWLGLN